MNLAKFLNKAEHLQMACSGFCRVLPQRDRTMAKEHRYD